MAIHVIYNYQILIIEVQLVYKYDMCFHNQVLGQYDYNINHSVYMKGYVAEFASAYSVQDCASMISNLPLFDAGISDDTEWLARRLSVLGYSENGRLGEVDVDAMRIMADTHRKTPFLPTIKFSSL